jgi:RNA polymerase sigma-70 factor, ECF subfamily
MQDTGLERVPLRTSTHSDAVDADAVDAALAAAGDSHAFERLYRRHVDRIHSLVRRMVGEESEDVTQEIFIRTWQKLATFRGDSAFGTWLHRLALNLILTRRETLGIHRKRHIDDPEPLERVPGKHLPAGYTMDVEAAIQRLPAGSKQVLVLHDVEGYRHEEIADMLAISVGTSKSQLHHARMALRRMLGAA